MVQHMEGKILLIPYNINRFGIMHMFTHTCIGNAQTGLELVKTESRK